MSILERLFGGNNPQAQTMAPTNPNLQAPNGHGPANPTSQPSQAPVQDFPGMKAPTDPNASNTNPGANPNGAAGESNPPMKEFADLFKVQEPNKNAPQSPFASFDTAKLQEQLAGTDFVSAHLNADLVQKISAGGEDAVKAMAVLMNKVGQETLSKAVQFSVRTAELGYNKSKESVLADLPSHIRQQSTNNELYSQHPNLRNPAAKPYIDDLTARLASQHPNATEVEIAGMAQTYLSGLAELLTKPEQKNSPAGGNGKPGNGTTDWTSFLT